MQKKYTMLKPPIYIYIHIFIYTYLYIHIYIYIYIYKKFSRYLTKEMQTGLCNWKIFFSWQKVAQLLKIGQLVKQHFPFYTILWQFPSIFSV